MTKAHGVLANLRSYIGWILLLEGMTAILLVLMLMVLRNLE